MLIRSNIEETHAAVGMLTSGSFGIAPAMMATFEGSWDLDDAGAVGFFISGCKRHGYFVLIPAVQHVPAKTHHPIPLFSGGHHD